MNKQGINLLKMLPPDGSVAYVPKLSHVLKMEGLDFEHLRTYLDKEGYIKILGRWCGLSQKGMGYAGKLRLAQSVCNTLQQVKKASDVEVLRNVSVDKLHHVSPVAAYQLKNFGIKKMEEAAKIPLMRLMEGTGLSFKEAVAIINEARIKLGWHKSIPEEVR